MPRRSAERITTRAAEAQTAGILWDQAISGFGLRVAPGGTKTWVLKYRAADGAQRWHRIGTFPAMAVEQARRSAGALRAQVQQGRDPSAERQEGVTAARAARAARAGNLAEAYGKALPGRPSLKGAGPITAEYAAAETAALRRALARIAAAELPVSKIGTAHLAQLLRIEAKRPATARNLFGVLRRFFDWCRDEGYMTTPNPCDEMPRAKRPKPPAPRTRVVALDDMARLWRGADSLPPMLRDLARVLIALPARAGEVAGMRWQDVDLARATWTQPAHLTKNGDSHRLALPPLALSILQARHAEAGAPQEGLVFPALTRPEGKGEPPIETTPDRWTEMKRRLRKATGFTAWTWHDFRRSFASIMAERGIPEPVADAVLNHRQAATRSGVMGVYQQATRWPEQQRAVEAWCAALAEALHPGSKPPSVVSIRRRRA